MPSQVTALAENQGLRQVEGIPLKHVTVQSTKTDMGALGGLGGLGARLGGRCWAAPRALPGAAARRRRRSRPSTSRKSTFRPATFELPDGYQETSLFQTGPAIPNLNGVQEATRRAESERSRRVTTRPWSARSLSPLAAHCCRVATCAETLDELLGSRALESVVHPIAAEFVAAEGATGLTEQQRATAVTQLKRALGRQTNPMTLTMRGAAGMMNSPSMQRMRESAQQSMSAGGLLRSAVGIGSAAPEIDAEQTQREMEQAIAEPWVRGIGAARALAALGDAEAAARFYVACLQMLQSDWAPTACLEDIIGLGPRRAEVLLTWMLDNAAALSSSSALPSLGALAMTTATRTPIRPAARNSRARRSRGSAR